MKHIKQEEWADFSRGLAGEREAAMTMHLQECRQCRKTAEMWQQVAEMASQEASLAPPESAVRIAKSAFASVPQEKRPMATRIADMIFDSRLEPALAGLRNSVTASPSQLLYRSGDYEIDLRLERDATGEHLAVTGQILSAAGRSVRGLQVAVISAVGPEAKGATNEFGEFHLEFLPGMRVQLFVWMCGGTNLLIPLDMDPQEGPKPQDMKQIRGGR